MVSQVTPIASSRDAILAAATEVFREAGFSGARVDEIARRSKANKAMIYYHFGSKQGLYRAVLLTLFSNVLEGVEALRASGLGPKEKLHALYRGVAAHLETKPALPHIMLREVLAGGEAMDADVGRTLGTILAFVSSTIQEGVQAGVFRPVHPLVLHLGVLAPLLVHSAGSDFRERLITKLANGAINPTRADMLGHLLDTLDRTLAPSGEPTTPARIRRSQNK